jgi:ketose-bisphosphate aldolase
MSQVKLSELLQQDCGTYAVGAFNVHTTEFIQGVVNAAQETGQPVILMIAEGVLRYGRIEILGAAALGAARMSKVPVAVMVDHGKEIPLLKKALQAGMDVMYDGSALPFQENVENTRYMVELAHSLGRCVEGEIGALGLSEDGEEEREQKLTTVEEAVQFYRETGVDVLAVSVGNVHGFYRGEAKIDLERAAQIAEALNPLPVVMHGGSDIPEETVRAAVRAGIRKYNIATDLKQAYADKMRQLAAQEPQLIQPWELFPPLAKAVQEVTERKIRLLAEPAKQFHF